MTRIGSVLATAAGVWLLVPGPTLGFDGFGDLDADSTYGEEIRLTVGLDGAMPDRLELLVWTPGDESATVLPVVPSGPEVTYVWNTAANHVTPNTLITYRWRAIDGEDVTLSEEATIRYEDDRPGLDWQRAQLGEATVHWYGGAESTARRFGELTAQGVARAEDLLGTELAGPVDIFVYDSRDEFFGALGPGVREWTGAAAYSELRTIFMWLGGGSPSYLEVAMLHEVTHIVFHDATDNPFHEPARWLNEGIATWSETSEGADERSIVALEAGGGGLFAFEAITEQFPIGERGGRLSYAQGTTMVDMIVDRYGEEALAAIAAAYREGASDADALEAGTGVPAEQLYADFYAEFGVDPPQPIAVEPIPPSNVDRPPAGEIDHGGVDPDAEPTTPRPPDDGAPVEGAADDEPSPLGLIVLLAVGAGAALAAVFLVSRRAARKDVG
ncbi:MAG: peptidase MA family metallohydrolase [Chloroflexota bacterium]|nr:peptidase MA family metallohydrolase [Chloroflexota bacterium]